MFDDLSSEQAVTYDLCKAARLHSMLYNVATLSINKGDPHCTKYTKYTTKSKRDLNSKQCTPKAALPTALQRCYYSYLLEQLIGS